MYTVKVTDENGIYMPASNIFDAVTGKYLGAAYEEGLTVNVPSIKITYIGFKPKEVTLKEGINTVSLEPQTYTLGTAEVVGYKSKFSFFWLLLIAVLIYKFK